jgi:hypothetical protein
LPTRRKHVGATCPAKKQLSSDAIELTADMRNSRSTRAGE